MVESFNKLGDASPFLFVWHGDDLIAIEKQYIDGEDNPVQVIKPNDKGFYDMSLSLCWQQI